MANTDKNIVIIPNRGQPGQPNVVFTGNANVPMTVRVADDNSLSFENLTGQLFSISNNVTTGTIFSVNDISGIPFVSVNASGNVSLVPLGGANVGVGTSSPQAPLDVYGNVRITANAATTNTNTGALTVTGNVGIGGNVNLGQSISLTNTTQQYSIRINGAGQMEFIPNTFASAAGTPLMVLDDDSAGLTMTGNITASAGLRAGNLSVTNTTQSTSTSTGAIVNAGGAGIAGNLFVGGSITGANVNVTGASAPPNGIFLPAANQLGFSVNNTERIRVDALGGINMGTTVSPYPFLGVLALTINALTPSVFLTSNNISRGYLSYTSSGGFSVIADTSGGPLNLSTASANAMTFSTNVIERMRIDSNSNVGIGTTVPLGNLHVMGNIWVSNNAAFAGGIRFPDSTFQRTAFVGVTATRQAFTATAGQTTFTVAGGYTPGQIDVYYNGVKLLNGTEVTVSSGTAVVLVTPATVGADVDVVAYPALQVADAVRKSGDTMTGDLSISPGNLIVNTDDLFVSRISGNVGIGTTTPQANLHVMGNIFVANSGAATGGIRFPDGTFQTTAATGGGGGGTAAFSASNITVTATSTNATFYPAFVEATSGNIGIRADAGITYNPSNDTLSTVIFAASDYIQVSSANNAYKLRLQSTGTGLRQLNLGVDDTTTKTFIDSTFSTTGAYPLQIRSGGTSGFEFSSTNLTVQLSTAATSTTTGALIVQGGAGVASNLFVGGSINGANVNVTGANAPPNGMWLPTASTLAFSTGSGERMRLDSLGNLSIGTTAVNYASANRAVLTLSGPSESLLSFAVAGSARGYLRTDGTSMVLQSDTGDTLLYTGGTGAVVLGTRSIARVRIDASGNVGIGTTTPLGNLHVMGNLWLSNNAAFIGGIRFPDGTFQTTAAAAGAGGGGTAAFSASNVTVTSTATAATFYPTFVENTTGNLGIRVDAGITYNPGSDSLSVAGTITTATWNGATVALNYGGTGLSTYANGDMVYATTSGTAFSRLAISGTNIGTGNVLLNNGSEPTWGRITLSNQNSVTGTLAVGNGGTGTATQFATGSVVFAGASGIYSQNNGQLFWDNTNMRLGIGTTTPAGNLHVMGNIILANAGTLLGGIRFPDGTFQTTAVPAGAGGTAAFSASNVTITSTSTNSVFYPTFVEATSGNIGLRIDTNFIFNPLTEALSLTGNILIQNGGRFGNLSVTNTTAATSTTTGALIVQGGAGVVGNVFAGRIATANSGEFGNIGINNTTAATSTTTGALIVQGGAGVVGNVFAGRVVTVNSGQFGNIGINNTTAATSTTTGALIVQGGAGVVGNVFAGRIATANSGEFGNIGINNTTAATSTTTGALIVQGGAGIAGNLFVGGSINGANVNVTGANTPPNGIFLPAANTLGFSTASGEDMRIDSFGNVSIGTTAVTYPNVNRRSLSINGTSQAIVSLATGGTARTYYYHDGATTSLVSDSNGGSMTLGVVSANPMVFNTNNTERMRIDPNGNVSIGTTNTTNRLTVSSTSNQNDGIAYTNQSTGAAAQALMMVNTQGALGFQFGQSYTSKNGFLYLGDNAAISVFTNATERLRVLANGNVSATTGNIICVAGELQSTGTPGAGGQVRMVSGGYGAMWRNDGSNFYLLFTGVNDQFGVWNALRPFYASVTTGRVTLGNGLDVTGTIAATSEITAYSSDGRLKGNVSVIPDALSKVLSIDGVTFDWLPETENVGFIPSKTRDVGVIAQRVMDVLPEAVALAPFDRDPHDSTRSKSGQHYLTVQYEKLTALLIEAVKEQQRTIEHQETRISSLEDIVDGMMRGSRS